MKKSLFLLPMIFLVFIPIRATKTKVSELPAHHKKWLKEEVVYIITPREREVFLELKTDRERDLFIEAFWKQRDPTPGSSENEFKNEHHRRLNYVNHFFGRGAPKPGWRTDQGRVYIILGEPMDILRLDGKTQTCPSEIWFYQGKTDLGLPPGFQLVFFQESGAGEYRLYSPFKDGPQKLLLTYEGDPVDYLAAYEQLREIEPELARVSLSLIPGDDAAAFGRPSMSSDLLIQKIETVPQKQIEDKYAQKFLQYKDIVEVEYTANYMDSDSLVKVIKNSSGINFVHYAIEFPRLSVNQYESKYYTKLKVNGTVLDTEGRTIYQFEKTAPLEFNPEQIKILNFRPFNFHDIFPIIPGSYKFSVLIKNEVSKEFTSLEQDILVPDEELPLQISSLLLGYKANRNDAPPKKPKPFLIGSHRIFCQPNKVFLLQDNLVVAFQIHGLNQKLMENGEIKFTFFKMGEEFRSQTRKISEYPEQSYFLEEFSLRDFPPAHYRIQVSFMADGQDVLIEKSEDFDITHLETVYRPWIYSRILPDIEDSFYPYILGTQLFIAGKVKEATISLEKAFEKNRNSVAYALALAQAYIASREYRKIVSILTPFLSQAKPRYEVYFMTGMACQNLGEWSKAIEIYDEAISHFGLNINLLNSIGECYFQLGEKEETLKAWEKSLEINPNQPDIKKNVEALRKRK